jgi:hypothetical protein
MTSKLKTDVLETVSGSGTIALTNQLSGMTSASVPSGSVLQVVSYYTAAQTAQTMSTSDQVINSMSKVITPLGANSKFLVQVRWVGEITSGQDVCFNIQMNGTRVNSGGGRGYYLGMGMLSYHLQNDNSTPETLNFSTLVSTSSVIGTDITFRLVSDCNGGSNPIWSNRCFGSAPSGGTEGGTSELIITEIKG